jgi:hypothetical protein
MVHGLGIQEQLGGGFLGRDSAAYDHRDLELGRAQPLDDALSLANDLARHA